MQVFPETKTAFVSTNSITQGLQTSVLWDYLFKEYKLEIFFGHRTFKWSSQARGKAAVYCVIIGFGVFKPSQTTNLFVKKIYNYPDVKSEEVEQVVTNISPYLVEGNNLTIKARSKPICSVPEMSFGNMPNDSGNLLFTEIEKIEFIKIEPKSKDYFKPIISAKEFLNNEKRFCLWLQGIAPNELKQMPNVLKRVEQVKVFRENSTREATRKLAFTPYLFQPFG